MIYLAPLQNFTDLTFRNVYFQHFEGIDCSVTPFISLMPAIKISAKRLKDVIPDKNFNKAVIPQVLGNQIEDFINISTYLFNEFGYQEINWNLGCPVFDITKKKRGAGLLCYPELIENFLESIIPAIPQKLSIKLRLGMNTADEFEKVIGVLNQFPIKSLMIHPRLGVQMYEGNVLLGELQQFIPAMKHSVVYNGDINHLDDYQKIKSLFPEISGVMLGRGVFSNPFLPEQIKAGSPQFAVDAIQRFWKFYFDLETAEKYAKKHWMNKMKEFWKYFSLFLHFTDMELQELLKITSETQWTMFLEKKRHDVATCSANL